MPFQPRIPATGLVGYELFKRTLPRQIDQYRQSPDLIRDVEYFRRKIGTVNSVDDLVGDRRLLGIALNAFGLGDEIDKRAFIRKILEEGTTSREAFAVRLNNPDYLAFARQFDFSNGKLSLLDKDISKIVDRFYTERFEQSVGEENPDMRLILNFRREIAELAISAPTENAGWFRALANVPLRTVLQSAFNLPEEFTVLDLDKQVDLLKNKTKKAFDETSIQAFLKSENIDYTVRQYLLRRQIEDGPSVSTPGFAALTLLNTGFSSANILSGIISRA